MRKEIEINGIKCKFKSSAAIPRMYRLKFNRDIFVDMNHIGKQLEAAEREEAAAKARAKEEGVEFNDSKYGSSLPIDSLEMFENIAFLMHKHGDPDQPQNIDEWLEQFETFDIYEILPQIMEMWGLENKQMSTAKKKTAK